MEHIACLSGGLDSSIMYLYLTGYIKGGPKVKDITSIFTDPGKEDPHTYKILDTLEKMTNTTIHRLHGPTWEQALEANAWFLPFHKARWCTPTFKIRPFQAFVKDTQVTSYIGLRADEPERKGYLGDKGSTIAPRYILREMGITRSDVEQLAQQISLPPTGRWSCGCCPFKTHYLQTIMIEEYPEMAQWMAWVEKEKRRRGGSSYTWIRGYTMQELIDNPILRQNIRRRYWARHHSKLQLPLFDNTEELTPCLMCQVK